jgi:hypothetical protein
MFNTSNFYQTLYENHWVSNVYDVTGYFDKTIAQKLIVQDITFKGTQIYSYQLFPTYLNYNVHLLKDFRLKKVKQKIGFAIYLKQYKTVYDYFKGECSTQHRKNIIRATNRLESSFNITYKTYFGDMLIDHYTFIMHRLKDMIANRFQQREGRNKTLNNWKHYVDQTLDLIKKKKASIFVIYNENKPIEISINYHIDSMMYSSISSYDLDYGKFSLGNIEIYKQLEWCMLNNICFFDMGYGDFEYKRKWSNHIYDFEDHIFYHKYNFLGSYYAFLKEYKYKLINYLITHNYNDKIYNLLDKFKKPKQTIDYLDYELITLTSLPNEINKFEKINLNNDVYRFLRQPVYDYLYKYQEHINNICLYENSNSDNLYIIQGKNSLVELKMNRF